MPLYTCPRCHNTFSSADKPTICPDCGHRSPGLSSDMDFDKYYSTRLSSIRDITSPSMTVDERNWTRVLLYLNKPRASYFTISFIDDHILEATPELALDTYKSMRWEFIKAVRRDKEELISVDIVEPEYMLRDGSGHPLITGWEYYGGALRTLYGFEGQLDPHTVPNIGAVKAIDLDRITTNPSDGYTKFLRAWLGLVTESTWRKQE